MSSFKTLGRVLQTVHAIRHALELVEKFVAGLKNSAVGAIVTSLAGGRLSHAKEIKTSSV
jgi:hypothetical protein